MTKQAATASTEQRTVENIKTANELIQAHAKTNTELSSKVSAFTSDANAAKLISSH